MGRDKLKELEQRIAQIENENILLTRVDPSIALSTDLRDLGDVKTFLEFSKLTATPDDPFTDVLLLYVLNGPSTANGGHTSVPSFIDSAGTTTIIDSGVYTPSLVNGTNVASSTAFDAQWLRIGEVVTVGGKFNCDPTSANIRTELDITLPVTSNFGNEEDCGGTVACRTFKGAGLVLADPVNDRAEAEFYPTSTSNAAWGFTFTYRLI